jgi:ubiquinone/menaquinone biosynthesis C-methylase UbiE
MYYSFTLSYYQKIFDTLAPRYRIVDILSFGLADWLRKQAIQKVSVRRDSRVIDLMCGIGSNVTHLAPSGNDIHYIGMDASGEMVKSASTRFPSETFLQTDILSPNQSILKADHILCSYGLKCISTRDYPRLALTIDQHAGKMGSFVFLEFQFPKNRLLRWLMKFYLLTVYQISCLLFLNSTSPATALIKTLENKLDPRYLCSLLIEKGFHVTLEYKGNNSVVFIYGKRS